MIKVDFHLELAGSLACLQIVLQLVSLLLATAVVSELKRENQTRNVNKWSSQAVKCPVSSFHLHVA